jgi:hypothetical protein
MAFQFPTGDGGHAFNVNFAVGTSPSVDPARPAELLNALAVNTGAEGPYRPGPSGVPATGGV